MDEPSLHSVRDGFAALASLRCALLGVIVFAAAPAAGQPAAAPVLSPLSADLGPANPDTYVVGSIGPVTTASAQVFINGAGPFRFIVDTGANSSALTRRVANELGLVTDGQQLVQGATGAFLADRVHVGEVRSGALHLKDQVLFVYDGNLLDGILGVDSLQGKRLEFDMRRKQVTIGPSRVQPPDGWTPIHTRTRFGPLVMVDGTIGRVKVKVVIDTGTSTTAANLALRRALDMTNRPTNAVATQIRLMGIDGNAVMAESFVFPVIRIGNLTVTDTPGVFVDLNTFRLWDLMDTPALLLGMDVLSHANGLAIDYRLNELQLKD